MKTRQVTLPRDLVDGLDKMTGQAHQAGPLLAALARQALAARGEPQALFPWEDAACFACPRPALGAARSSVGLMPACQFHEDKL